MFDVLGALAYARGRLRDSGESGLSYSPPSFDLGSPRLGVSCAQGRLRECGVPSRVPHVSRAGRPSDRLSFLVSSLCFGDDSEFWLLARVVPSLSSPAVPSSGDLCLCSGLELLPPSLLIAGGNRVAILPSHWGHRGPSHGTIPGRVQVFSKNKKKSR